MTNIHKALQGLRTVLYVLLLTLSPAFAEDSVYTVEGVEVDVTAENAVEAREKAFEEAQVKAFEQLTERLLTVFERETFEAPEVDTISGFVQDFEVTNEQLSAVRYKGTYTFRFRPNAVQQFMTGSQMAYSDTPQETILILPYLQRGAGTILWENNPFMAAWARSAPSKGMAATVLPMGDLLDVSQIKDDPALRYDLELMKKVAGRYEAQKAVILIAEPKPDNSLSVSMYSADGPMPIFMKTLSVAPTAGQPDIAVYEQAVQEVRAALRQDWKKQTEVLPGQVSTLKARARFTSVQEWVRLKRSIENVAGVNAVKVQGLKPREAIIRIEYQGGEARLMPALSQAGILLNAPNQSAPYNAQMPGETIYDISLGAGGRY